MLESTIYRECTGLILDESQNWRPVCVPPPHIVELSHSAEEGTADRLLCINSSRHPLAETAGQRIGY